MNFGYSWWLTRGHLALASLFALAAFGLTLLNRAPRTKWGLLVLAAWAVAAFLVVRVGFGMEAPLKPPTPRFLAAGGGKVLDLGCGSGRASIGLLLSRPSATVVGRDNWSAPYIKANGQDRIRANARAAGVESRLSVSAGDMRELPFENGSFDAVMSAYAVDHLDDAGIDAALAEAARVLRPGGEVLILNMANDFWVNFAYTPLYGMHHIQSSSPRHSGDTRQSRTPEAVWRSRFVKAGLEVVEAGKRPATLYFLSRKPGAGAPKS